MQRKHNFLSQRTRCSQNSSRFERTSVFAALIKGDQQVLLALKMKALRDALFLSHFPVAQQSINHHIPCQIYSTGDVLLGQIIDRRLCGAQEEVGTVVGKNAVCLFRHRLVIASETSFNMGDHFQLGSSQGACQRLVGVPVDQHQIGFLQHQHFLYFHKNLTRLRSVRA